MKNIYRAIKKFGDKQSFQPNLSSFFINPNLFIRWYLYINIRNLAPKLGGKLLDFGCGRKPYCNLFSNVKEYVGIDIEVSGHPHKESLVDIYYNGKVIPFDDEYFDSIFCSEVIEHVFNVEEVLSEIHRVLKVDGIALFTFPFAYQEHEKPYDFARYTSYASKHIFEKNGFKIIEQRKAGHFSVALLQLWINYIYVNFASKNKYINVILTVIFISPFNLIGLLCLVLPVNTDLYFSNILLLKKNE